MKDHSENISTGSASREVAIDGEACLPKIELTDLSSDINFSKAFMFCFVGFMVSVDPWGRQAAPGLLDALWVQLRPLSLGVPLEKVMWSDCSCEHTPPTAQFTSTQRAGCDCAELQACTMRRMRARTFIHVQLHLCIPSHSLLQTS